MSHIALIGASGSAGSRILRELTDRGHRVTAIARHPERIAELPGVTAVKGDAQDLQGLTSALRGHDAVVSAVNFTSSEPHTLIEAVRASGVKRYLVVGGAGSLEIAPGQRVIDLPDFPEATKLKPLAARPSSSSSGRKASLNGPFCRLRPSSSQESGQASFALAKMRCSATRKAAVFHSKTTP